MRNKVWSLYYFDGGKCRHGSQNVQSVISNLPHVRWSQTAGSRSLRANAEVQLRSEKTQGFVGRSDGLAWSWRSLLSWVFSDRLMICSDNIVCREDSMQTGSGNVLDWFDRGRNESFCLQGVCRLRDVQCIYNKSQHRMSHQSWSVGRESARQKGGALKWRRSLTGACVKGRICKSESN